jgi:hypothetical protein
MVYNIDGIPTEHAPRDQFWIQTNGVDFVFSNGDITSELDQALVDLNLMLMGKLFGDLSVYVEKRMKFPEFINLAGTNAESDVTKEAFEDFVKKNEANTDLCRLLYMQDIRTQLTSLQNVISQSKILIGNFYQDLNVKSFLIKEKPDNLHGPNIASGPIVAGIYSIVSSIFVNLYSQLDYVTKIAFEISDLELEFLKYPKLKSAKVIFGDRKNLKINHLAGSVFEDCESINMIMTLRNDCVHNASIETDPKVYQMVFNGVMVEKFVPLPDMENGHLQTFRNRRRFFAKLTKLNEILPELVIDFWKRMLVTVNAIKNIE